MTSKYHSHSAIKYIAKSQFISCDDLWETYYSYRLPRDIGPKQNTHYNNISIKQVYEAIRRIKNYEDKELINLKKLSISTRKVRFNPHIDIQYFS